MQYPQIILLVIVLCVIWYYTRGEGFTHGQIPGQHGKKGILVGPAMVTDSIAMMRRTPVLGGILRSTDKLFK